MDSQTEIAITSSNSVPLHCQQRTASGRRCRMAISDPDSGLCARHVAQLQRDLDRADLAASLIGDIQEFRSAADINHSLGELYKLQAHNRISPRRAAVMAYTANLLLRTLPAIASEKLLEFQQHGPLPVADLSDWPNSIRSFVPGVSPMPDYSNLKNVKGPGVHATLDALFPGRKKQSLEVASETSGHEAVAGGHPEGQNGNAG
jgi:hypothetical protein